MPLSKDPMLWKIQTWIFLTAIGVVAGISGYLKLKRKKLSEIDFGEMCADTFLACSVTYFIFTVLNSRGVESGWSASLAGGFAHSYIRGIFKRDSKMIKDILKEALK